MKSRIVVASAALLCGLLIFGGGAWAMTSTNYAINWNVIGGGGQPASSANYTARGTVGQPAAETSSSASYELGAGYWHKMAAPGENTAPAVSNVIASQGSGTGIVNISYDVSDAEQATASISFQYWDGSTWQECATATGEGSYFLPASVTAATWNAKVDFDGQYLDDCRIKVVANDGQASDNIGQAESDPFALDTKAPTGYGCSTPANDATGISVNPTLTALAASDDSPPISYMFRLASNAEFTEGVQESTWVGSASWSPPTLAYDTEYWWKVKARDVYANEGDYNVAFKFTTASSAGPGISWNFPSTSDVFLGPSPANSRPYLGDAVPLPTGTEPEELSGVYWLDETTGGWQYFIPGWPVSTVTSLDPGQVYLVAVSGACSWNLPCEEGTASPTGNTWNFPSTSAVFLSPTPQNGRPYLGAAVGLPTGTEPEELSGVYWLDEETGAWQYFIPGWPVSTVTSLDPGQAYLVAVSGACSWALS